MLKWLDVIKYANNGNPAPDKRVEKTEKEWKVIETILETLQEEVKKKQQTTEE